MEKSFAELLEETEQTKRLEKIVTGKIISISQKGEIYVDLNYKADGIIPREEYSFSETDNPSTDFKPGDEITAEVLKNNDGQGNVLLSYKKLKSRQERIAFEEKVKNGEIFEEKVSEINDKGLIVKHNDTRIFIPLSLSGLTKNDDKNDMIGKKVKFKITEYNPEERKIIGSIKILEDEEKQERRKEFWNNAEIGKNYKGTIKNITNYGMFIDLGEIQGLLHISEISWSKNTNLNKMFNVGDVIDVTIKEMNPNEGKIQLSYLNKGEDPWNNINEKYNINDIVTCVVVSLTNFGAFLLLEEGIEGLVHVSQISEERIAKPEDKLKVGQKVNAKIINIDEEKRKIELSIRELEGTSNEYIEEI